MSSATTGKQMVDNLQHCAMGHKDLGSNILILDPGGKSVSKKTLGV